MSLEEIIPTYYMLNLIVLSKHQWILDGFSNTLLRDPRLSVYVVHENLEVPYDFNNIYRTEYHPNKYFNMLCKEFNDDDYVGIVNDDIVFSENWLDDVLEKLGSYKVVSPGFIEANDYFYFRKRLEQTKDLEGINEGIFDAFYCFPVSLWKELGPFDEEIVDWYDIDWHLKVLKADYKPVISKKITIMHLKRATYSLEEPSRSQIRSQILSKWGKWGLNTTKSNSVNVREIYV